MRSKRPVLQLKKLRLKITSVDIVRAMTDHPRSKIHKRAVGLSLSEDTVQQLAVPDPVRDELLANHLYIAVSYLVKLKPAQHFIDGLSDSLEVGGSLDPSKWGSRAFYDQVLEHADEQEVATLTNELASTPFPDALVLSADAKEHVNGARIYFIGPVDRNGCYHVLQRCLDVRKLHRVNHESVYQQLETSMREVRSSVSCVGCFLADGCNVNGVQPRQLPTGDNVWALLRSNNKFCLRWWAACHRENLALKDLWEDEELSEFLGEVDAFLNSVAKCLQMSPPLQDELVFFTNMVVASFKPGQSHSMEHAASRWNSRKPLICNVSNSYGAWVLYTRRHSTCANDSWARHHAWLLKPTTYIRFKGIADVLEIYDRKGLLANQFKDPLKDGATDVEQNKRELCAELDGYVLAEPPQQGEVDATVVRRLPFFTSATSVQRLYNRESSGGRAVMGKQ